MEYNPTTKTYKKVVKSDKKELTYNPSLGGDISFESNNEQYFDSTASDNENSTTEEDILDELNIEKPVEESLQDIIEETGTQESTSSENPTNLEDTQETTQAVN